MNNERLNQIYNELENQKNSLRSMSGDISNIETRIDMLKEELSKAKTTIVVPMINRLLVPESVWKHHTRYKDIRIIKEIHGNTFLYWNCETNDRCCGESEYLFKNYTLMDTGLVRIADYQPPEDCIIELIHNDGWMCQYRLADNKIYGLCDSIFSIDAYPDMLCDFNSDSAWKLSDFAHWRLSGTLAEMAQEKLRGE